MRKKQNTVLAGTIKDQFNKDIVEVVTEDLRALLFWANVGVGESVSGSYCGEIEEIIRSYSEYLCYQLKPRKFRTKPKRISKRKP